VPAYFVARDLDRGKLTRIMPRVRMPVDWFRLVWRKDHPRQAALHALAEELTALALR
jgi:DNA-binding transcriptional LysR family regulator